MKRLFICPKAGMLKPIIENMFEGQNMYYSYDESYDSQRAGKALYKLMSSENIQEVYMVDLKSQRDATYPNLFRARDLESDTIGKQILQVITSFRPLTAKVIMGEVALHNLVLEMSENKDAKQSSTLSHYPDDLIIDESDESLTTTRLNLVSEHLNRLQLN